MSASIPKPVSSRVGAGEVVIVFVRWITGALFIFMGRSKAMHPVEFLKLVWQYGLLHDHLLLNVVASTVPWLEVFWGLLLLLGVAVRGAAAMLLVMIVSFSVAVLFRAVALRDMSGPPFCSIKFDCGCGTGEMFVCSKLGENLLLAGLSVAILFRRNHRLCLRQTVFPAR